MKLLTLTTINVIFFSLFLGCSNATNVKVDEQPNLSDVSYTDSEKQIAIFVEDMSIDDRKKLLMCYGGLQPFLLKNKNEIHNTLEVFILIEDFQKQVGYVREKDKDFTDYVEKMLQSAGLSTPKQFGSEPEQITIENFSLHMNTIFNGVRLSIENE